MLHKSDQVLTLASLLLIVVMTGSLMVIKALLEINQFLISAQEEILEKFRITPRDISIHYKPQVMELSSHSLTREKESPISINNVQIL